MALIMQQKIDTKKMEAEARTIARKTKASDAKKLNDIKEYSALLEWYKKKSECYYDCLKNGKFKRDIKIREFMGQLTTFWEDIVAEEERKPQKEGAQFRIGWLFAATYHRRMVEPLDIGDFYTDGNVGVHTHMALSATRGKASPFLVFLFLLVPVFQPCFELVFWQLLRNDCSFWFFPSSAYK